MEGERVNQVCTVPAFRGTRCCYNQYATSEEATAAVPVTNSTNLREQLNEEYLKYAALLSEGTGDFYAIGGTTKAVAPVFDKSLWFLSANS